MKQVDVEEAMSKRYPEIVVLVTQKSKDGKVNITPLGWAMPANSKPRCWAISIAKKHYSNKVINETKEFCLCLPSLKQKEDTLYCGGVSGWDVDKLGKCSFELLPATRIKSPLLKNSIACFECKVIGKFDAPDHTVFIGEVVAAHVSDRKDKLYNLGNHNLQVLK